MVEILIGAMFYAYIFQFLTNVEATLKYMHTSVELLDTNVIRESGRLLAHFLNELDEGWDSELWS